MKVGLRDLFFVGVVGPRRGSHGRAGLMRTQESISATTA